MCCQKCRFKTALHPLPTLPNSFSYIYKLNPCTSHFLKMECVINGPPSKCRREANFKSFIFKNLNFTMCFGTFKGGRLNTTPSKCRREANFMIFISKNLYFTMCFSTFSSGPLIDPPSKCRREANFMISICKHLYFTMCFGTFRCRPLIAPPPKLGRNGLRRCFHFKNL